MNTFMSDDAQRIFEHLAPVEAAKAGRDFVYTLELASGTSVTGQVVERTDTHLALVVEDPTGNRAADVPWDEICRICIESASGGVSEERHDAAVQVGDVACDS